MSNPRPSPLEPRLQKLRAALQSRSPAHLALLTGAQHIDPPGELRLALWEKETAVSIPDFVACDSGTGKELTPDAQALLLFYLATADGAAESGRWVSFADLPGGRFYNQAFQGYTGHELAKIFGNDTAAFKAAAGRLNGQPHPLGEAASAIAFAFRALPRVRLLVAAWLGDEEFPPSYQVLFDAAVCHFLPVDVCAILGGMLTRRLIRSRQPNSG
jgi:hypothetical protein